jgi:hypothetical protein
MSRLPVVVDFLADIYAWMVGRIETCVAAGWLRDA